MEEKAGSPPSYEESQFGFLTIHEAGGYPPQGTGGYPKQGAGGYLPQGAGGYPPQGTGCYPPQGAGCYPPQGAGGYPQPGFYEQTGYMQPRYSSVQHTAQEVIVHQPGAAGHVIYQSRPTDYMASSIFACLCCFWPTGLCAIYFASQANALAAQGNMAEATRMSNNARNLMITSVVIGIIWIILVIVLRVFVFSCYYSYTSC